MFKIIFDLGDLSNWIMVITTIFLAVIAIWGDYWKSKVFKLTLEIKLLDPEPSYNINNNKLEAYVYHLQIIKTKGFGLVKNSRLLLTKIQNYNNNTWVDIPWNVARQFNNAPLESDARFVTFLHKQTVDFGYIYSRSNQFSPALRDTQFNRNDQIISVSNDADLKRRYFVEIEAENYYSSKQYIFEVTWNGKWSDDPIIMNINLIIKPISL